MVAVVVCNDPVLVVVNFVVCRCDTDGNSIIVLVGAVMVTVVVVEAVKVSDGGGCVDVVASVEHGYGC